MRGVNQYEKEEEEGAVGRLTVEHGGRERPLARRKAHRQGIVGDGENDNDVTEDAEKAPAEKQPELGFLEQILVERDMDGANGLVPVPHNQTACPVHHEGYDSQNPKRPGQAEVGYHGVGSQRVGQAAEARAARGDRVCEGPLLSEPLRDHADGGREAKAETEAEAQALAEEEMPDVGGK